MPLQHHFSGVLGDKKRRVLGLSADTMEGDLRGFGLCGPHHTQDAMSLYPHAKTRKPEGREENVLPEVTEAGSMPTCPLLEDVLCRMSISCPKSLIHTVTTYITDLGPMRCQDVTT